MAFYRCELLVGGYSYDVTDCLVNWEDVELAYKRGEYDGVVRSFSTKFEFAGGAYSLLLGEYRTNYLQASASVVFYTRTNSWEWQERFRCALDFSTFAYTGTTCEVNAVDDSLASLIKAKQGTEYEYSVEKIKDGKPLRYDRIAMTSMGEWTIPLSSEEESYELEVSGGHIYVIPMYVLDSEIAIMNSAEAVDLQERELDGQGDLIRRNPDYYFFKYKMREKATASIKCSFRLYTGGMAGTLYLMHSKQSIVASYPYHLSISSGASIYNVSIDIEREMEYGDSLFMALQVGDDSQTTTVTFAEVTTPMEVSFTGRGEFVDIDAVKPSTLLNRLLKSMNGGQDGITGEIATGVDTRLDNTLLLAAESVRGLEGAKFRTSYTKFCNWMSAEFGFVPVVDDASKKVTFVHRESLFKDTEVKDLGDDCTEFQYTVNEGLIHARVRVGYDKVDYDSVNGRDEFRWTNSYETGVTLTDTSLDLISPYRADAYGIEFLAAKRGEETTDDGSDNDVFMAGAMVNDAGSRYELIRGGDYAVTGVISPDTMFNGMYAQRFMVAANEKYIGAFATGLTCASAEGNGDASVGGVRTDADLDITGRLFTVGEVEVETGNQSVPSDLGGYITLVKNGLTYKGYVKEAGFGVGKAQAVRYTLIVKEIS